MVQEVILTILLILSKPFYNSMSIRGTMSDISPLITYDEFLKVDIRVGTVVGIELFPEARKPAYKLLIDFGSEIGIKKSSAQITERYPSKDELIGKQVMAVVNFPSRQIGPFMSEVLTLGVSDENGKIILVHPGLPAPNGKRLH